MMIYTSPHPPIDLPRTSIFSHLFSSHHFPGAFPNSASAPAFIDAVTGFTITRSQLKDLALRWAHGILHVFPSHPARERRDATPNDVRVCRGDTVMIFSTNSIAFPVVLHGSTAAGLRVTLANSSYTPSELSHQYIDSGAKLIFVHPSLLPVVFSMFEGLRKGSALEEMQRRVVVVGGDGWGSRSSEDEKREMKEAENKLSLRNLREELVWIEDLLNQGALSEEEKFIGSEIHETVYLCYSSGTTGKPKGVETTHYNMTSQLTAISPYFYPDLKPSEDVHLAVLPFYHTVGLVKLLHHPCLHGIPTVIMPRFDPVAFCANIEKYKVTVALIVPPLFVHLANHPAVEKYDLRTLKSFFSGAAPLALPLLYRVKERLLSLGIDVNITQGYGLTECSPSTHLLPLSTAVAKVGSMGVLVPNVEARLIAESGLDVEDSDEKGKRTGELWVRGPTIMKGYLNNPTATQASITSDGWFKTGDVVARDREGYYYVVDRKKELIKYKGFQVAPAELESVLLQHPDIADVAVVGVYDANAATELPRAYVVAKANMSVQTAEERAIFERKVEQWIRPSLARHKWLRGGVVVTNEIPRSPAGKILRRELRERAKQELSTISQEYSRVVAAKL